MGTYSYSTTTSNDIIKKTITTTGTYDITGYGGSGGSERLYAGGNGAEVSGNFVLQAGEKLEIIVGGAGINNGDHSSGGGGGSFVLANTGATGSYVPLLVAGGGGGAADTGAGEAGTVGARGNGSGGATGGGGYDTGAGGAGIKSNGANGTGHYYSPATGGQDVANGASGGKHSYGGHGYGSRGGFGGGGGSSYGGGGGGGYTGGAGGASSGISRTGRYGGGYGGTSFDAGQANAAQTGSGQNAGAGKVSIAFVSTVCYASGTLIRTAHGGVAADVAVEDLAVGDLVVTSSGAHRPIRWLGHRDTDCRRHPRPQEVMPVRVAAHAFGPDKPARDLLVSPWHSLCVDVVGEVLILACALVNGSTITQEDVERVTYWHVELDGHDILLAENLGAESYLDMGNRAYFAGGAVVALDASPDAPPDAPARTHADFCRPFHGEGPLVDVVRAQLAARAARLGWHLEAQGLGDLHLLVEGVRVAPRVRGLVARFVVPAAARDVWLVSSTNTPKAVANWPDERRLGACLKGLAVDDGFGAARAVALDDPRLCIGFHALERDGDARWRWTAGRARLPASLWDGLDDDFLLRVELDQQALPRWTAPVAAAGASVALAR